MKLKVKVAGYFYNKGEEVEKLKALGFKFKPLPAEISCYKDRYDYIIDSDEDVNIELNSLDDLQCFIEEYGSVVLDGESLTIYNDYLE